MAIFFSININECFLHPPDETQYGRNRSQVIGQDVIDCCMVTYDVGDYF